MKRRIAALLTCLALALGLAPGVLAASGEQVAAADRLYALGLISGTGTDERGNPIYELDRAPTRSEAITVLVKLLGKDAEAARGGWETPFTDVAGWAQNYVGYAYAHGLTAGTSATTFGGDDLVTAAQYITFVLKALGYSADGDFAWDRSWELSDRLGVTGGRYGAATASFTRGDVFLISDAALGVAVKSGSQTLADTLIAAGAFTRGQYDKTYGVELKELSAEQIYAKCSPAVFYLEVYDASGKAAASGSGFFLTSSGVAVTNYHVIDGAYSAKILTAGGGQTYEVEGAYDWNEEEDWAVLQIAGSGFPTLEVGDASTVVGGAAVYAIGSPLGLENTISQGIVSNVNRVLDGTGYIQTTAPISHGSSGGALINKYGQVIGITSAGYEEGENLGLALPISVIDGYDADGTVPLLTVTTGIPADATWQEAAYLYLRAFVLNNANGTIGTDKEPVYETRQSTSAASHYRQMIFTTEGDVVLRYVASFRSGATAIASLYLSGDEDEFYHYFASYATRASQDPEIEGDGWLDPGSFDGKSVVFKELTGSADDRAYAAEMAPAMIKSLLGWADDILQDYSGGLCDMSDFGFDT